jgi:hypothetical protein
MYAERLVVAVIVVVVVLGAKEVEEVLQQP